MLSSKKAAREGIGFSRRGQPAYYVSHSLVTNTRYPVKRILTARFMHETNTFSRVPTDMAMIRRRDYHLENEIPEAFRGTRSAFGATFEAADKFGWTLVHPVSANPNPSGTVTDDAFEQITGMILGAVDAKGPIDVVLLFLHGAMVSENHEDAEGEFLARLRRRLGPD